MKIVTIGGGGGHAQVLRGLRALPGLSITAVCPSTDSGGSTGQLVRDYRGVGYLGDLTKCIAALCPDPALAKALMWRFSGGAFSGHSLKNLLFLALQRSSGTGPALELMYRLTGIAPHRVLPVTPRSAELRARLKYGNEVRGETNIDLIAQNPLWHPDIHAIEGIFLKPPVRASGVVTKALRSADWIIVCPGDLYSSILPVLLPGGIHEAIASSKARIAVVLNIMTKKGETHGYSAEDFLARIEQHLGRPCDVILANRAPVPKRSKLAYALERKVQLVSKALRGDRRVRSAALVKVTSAGEVHHDERALAREFSKIITL